MGLKVLFVVKEIDSAEPIGLLYIAGCLMQAGHTCKVIGTRGINVEEVFLNYEPDVLACGATTGLHKYYLGLMAHLKKKRPQCITLLGGHHVTYFPETIQHEGLDVICRGEGEDASVELCHALENGLNYRNIEDLWVKYDGQIYKNPQRKLRRDVDSIPFPPRELLYEFDERLKQLPVKSFTTNRGCPFPCSYCFNQSMADLYGNTWKKVRIRSPQNVVDEIKYVQSIAPVQIIAFRESIFVYNVKWLKEFGALYRQEIGLPYYCHLRADMLNEEMVELLAWSGCQSVNLGIETANEELANTVLKRNIRHDKLIKGIKLLKKAGIVVFSDNIIGIPGGTLKDDLETLKLNIELKVDYAACTLCTPYPGTGIAKYAIEHGYFDGNYNLIDYSYYTESVIKFSSKKEKRQIENLQKLFAVTAALPIMLPLTRLLIKLPPNDFFYAIFRSWYLLCHLTDVMPRSLTRKQLKEGISSIFGVYHDMDNNEYPMPPLMDLPVNDSMNILNKEPEPVLT